LTLSETVVIGNDQSDELLQIKEKLNKYKVLDDILGNLEQPQLKKLIEELTNKT